MSKRQFPHPVAVFSDRLVFTTLSSRDVSSHGRNPFTHPDTGKPCFLFTLDAEMSYTAFALDHGPLNLNYVFHACVKIHDKLTAKEYKNKVLCLYTSPDAKKKSNMTLMVALYFLIVQHHAPWEAFRPIANFEIVPFRDAGNGPMDFALSIQDCLYGIHKAISHNLLNLADFDAAHYTHYEQVANGDLNILGDFIPFASPIEQGWLKAVQNASKKDGSPRGTERAVLSSEIPKGRLTGHGFKSVMEVFRQAGVGLVVRLNDELYDKRHFLEAGMDHMEMYFDDGSNPSDDIVREFIRMAKDTIEGRGKKVAVHCKAGLGRTGVLIGAYLIYKYHFSAQEVIGYMRIVRPGMVVGAQQQYMVMNQMKWAGWAARDEVLRNLAEAREASPEQVNPLATPPLDHEPLLSLQALLPRQASTPDRGTLAQSLDLTSPKHSQQIRSSTPKALASPPKGGDAVGQPRKSPQRPVREETTPPVEPVVPKSAISMSELASPTPSRVPRLTFREPPPEVLSSSQTSPTSETMRGIKRASSRSPLTRPTSPTSRPRSSAGLSLAVPPALLRQDSTSSIASSSTEEERPPKRRSPRTEAYLSSPPPSRESTPAEVEEEVMAVDPPAPPSTPSGGIGDLTNKMRRSPRASGSPPQPTLPDPTTSPVSVLAQKPLPTRRSFLPRRITPQPHVKEGDRDEVMRLPSGGVERPSPAKVKGAREREASASPKRAGMTPAKFGWGDMLGGMTRRSAPTSSPTA